MSNLRHIIDVNVSDRWIKVINNKNQDIKVEFVDLISNSCLYQSTIEKFHFALCNYYDFKSLRLYIREYYDHGFDLHVYDFQIMEDSYSFTKIPKEISFDFDQEFVLINGHAGGGTSIVTKFLKYLGINAGDDSGPLHSRKPHEPYGIKLWVGTLDQTLPKVHHKDNFLKIIKTYGYQKGNINVFKIPESNYVINNLIDIFPRLKIISIVKKPTSYFVTSEGKRFHEQDELEIYKIQHPNIEGGTIFHLDFVNFFTDFNYVNKVLNYLGSSESIDNQGQLDFIKKQIDFKSEVLR